MDEDRKARAILSEQHGKGFLVSLPDPLNQSETGGCRFHRLARRDRSFSSSSGIFAPEFRSPRVYTQLHALGTLNSHPTATHSNFGRINTPFPLEPIPWLLWLFWGALS